MIKASGLNKMKGISLLQDFSEPLLFYPAISVSWNREQRTENKAFLSNTGKQNCLFCFVFLLNDLILPKNNLENAALSQNDHFS